MTRVYHDRMHLGIGERTRSGQSGRTRTLMRCHVRDQRLSTLLFGSPRRRAVQKTKMLIAGTNKRECKSIHNII